MKRNLIALTLALIMLLGMVGCASQSAESSPTDSAEAATTGDATPAATEAVEESSIPTDGVLTIGLYGSPTILDPQKSTSYADVRLMVQLYDTLVVMDYDMQTIKPGLATEWTVSEDGTVYTFKLRNDVTFHSGKPFTAADVKYTFDRWLADETASPTKTKIKSISEVNVIDDYTVEFVLSAPCNTLLTNLTLPYASILNQESVESAGDQYGVTVVDGTGPFKLNEMVIDDRVVLDRNDAYTWGSPIYENSGPAYIKQIICRVIPEEGTRLMELEAGSVDMLVNNAFAASEFSSIQNMPNVTAIEFQENYPTYMGFNTAKGCLTDINVRKAINMAANKDEIIQAATAGYATAMDTPLSPGAYAYCEGLGYAYDVDAANALLEESGWKLADDGYRYKDGTKLTLDLMYGSMTEFEVIATVFQSQMKAIGMEVTVQEMDWSTYFAALNAGEHEAFLMNLTYNHPDDMLGYYFASANMPYPNRFNFSDSRVDELINVGLTSSDEQEILNAYYEIQKIVVDDAVWLPLYNKNGLMAITDSVKNFKAHGANFDGLTKALDFYKD